MDRPDEKTIEKVLVGLATQEEARQVARWLATEEGSEYFSEHFYKECEHFSQEDAELLVNHEIPGDKMWEAICSRIRRRKIKQYVGRVAAVLLPLVLVIGLYFRLDSRVNLFGTGPLEELYVPKGERIQMAFQDGTRMYINSDSHLKYPVQFGLGDREVEFEGEAYFKVAKNEKRPFIVKLGDTKVKVLGTSFNVNAYSENEQITVELDEGKIDMVLAKGDEVRLHPGESFVYDKATCMYRINKVENVGNSSAWKDNILSFKDERIEDVMVKLERWFDVEFVVDTNLADNILITLSSQNATLESVLSELEMISPLTFRYEKKEKKVYVEELD